jgi:hypothetical protein
MELLTDALTYAGNLENLKDADEAEITTVYSWRYNGFSTLIIEASYIPIPPHLPQNPNVDRLYYDPCTYVKNQRHKR